MTLERLTQIVEDQQTTIDTMKSRIRQLEKANESDATTSDGTIVPLNRASL